MPYRLGEKGRIPPASIFQSPFLEKSVRESEKGTPSKSAGFEIKCARNKKDHGLGALPAEKRRLTSGKIGTIRACEARIHCNGRKARRKQTRFTLQHEHMKEGILMPRKPREFVADGIYHVFNRGNNLKTLFDMNEDFERFKAILARGHEREGIQIYHYCLMSSHDHLLIRSQTAEGLPRFMHWTQLGYARYFKKRHQTTGHVFEERYRSPRIAEESYYLQCGRYIERNPVKARIAAKAEDYPHSSAAYYVRGKKDPLVTENLCYRALGANAEERRRNYEAFVRMEEPYAEMISDRLLKY